MKNRPQISWVQVNRYIHRLYGGSLLNAAELIITGYYYTTMIHSSNFFPILSSWLLQWCVQSQHSHQGHCLGKQTDPFWSREAVVACFCLPLLHSACNTQCLARLHMVTYCVSPLCRSVYNTDGQGQAESQSGWSSFAWWRPLPFTTLMNYSCWQQWGAQSHQSWSAHVICSQPIMVQIWLSTSHGGRQAKPGRPILQTVINMLIM